MLGDFYRATVLQTLHSGFCHVSSRDTSRVEMWANVLFHFRHIFVTFFINFPRGLIARHTTSKVAKFIGEQEFELSKHVLDVVYSQTICWLGSFYAPFLPAIAAMLNFLMFYIKKFACLVNSKPSSILYRASRSNSLFMIILLLSFTIAIIPVVYAIAELIPSKSCGPFRLVFWNFDFS